MATLKEDLATAQTRITELDEVITTLTAGAKLHASAIEAKDAEFAVTTAAARDAHALVIEAKDAEIKTLTGSVAKLTSEAKDSNTGAREIAARHGVNLPEKDAKLGDFTKTGSATSMARDDFAALSATAKRAFFKAGGKLTD